MNTGENRVKSKAELELLEELKRKREAVFEKYGDCREYDLPPYQKELDELTKWYFEELWKIVPRPNKS